MKQPTIIDAPLSPSYVLEEEKLRQNLSFIKKVTAQAGVEPILALKAFAQWQSFPIFREYIAHTTASSPDEARLSADYFGGLTYTYSPAYEESTFNDVLKYSEHITFNSLSQYNHFYNKVCEWIAAGGHPVSLGLRINPEYSDIETELYNPCAPGSRFGILDTDLPEQLPEGIEGFHFHCLCENDAESLSRVLEHVERRFGKWFPQLKWLNMGGGHLMTREGYQTDLLIERMMDLHIKYPNLQIIMEPGSAFLWQTGYLVASVVDIVQNHGIRTAILNVSFTCHMPDCLEMPYHPAVRGAQTLINPDETMQMSKTVYRLGGNSCLSGDYMGYWDFGHELKVGEEIIFEDMIHYTTVKTNRFNGVHHPDMVLKQLDGTYILLKHFGYESYRDTMN